jgi:hypothetical protein
MASFPGEFLYIPQGSLSTNNNTGTGFNWTVDITGGTDISCWEVMIAESVLAECPIHGRLLSKQFLFE